MHILGTPPDSWIKSIKNIANWKPMDKEENKLQKILKDCDV